MERNFSLIYSNKIIRIQALKFAMQLFFASTNLIIFQVQALAVLKRKGLINIHTVYTYTFIGIYGKEQM